MKLGFLMFSLLFYEYTRLYMCMCRYHMHEGPEDDRKGHQVHWNLNFRVVVRSQGWTQTLCKSSQSLQPPVQTRVPACPCKASSQIRKEKKTLICKSIRSLQSEHSSGRQGSADKRGSSPSRTWSLAALESAAASAEKTLYWFETLVDVSLSSCRNKTKEQNQYPIILKLVVRDANCN